MKIPLENREQDGRHTAPLDFLVPGLDAAAQELLAAYPDLSEASLARVLGLPTRETQPEVLPRTVPQGGEANQ